VTFPSSIADGPNASEARWPGLGGNVSFDEGLEVGYRWYDAHNVAPLFPFGHGLSYTTFQLSGMTATRLPGRRMDVAVTVKNIGTRAGSDVVQAYVEMPPAVGEPPRRLAGFTKVRLAIGAQTRVHMVIPVQSFSHWDVVKHRWLSPAGAYTIRVGESSRQLPLSTSVTMTTPLYTGRVGPAPTALPPAAGPSCTT
jgi:beta-glucosidase